MQLIRCTRKLQREGSLPKAPPLADESSDSLLGDWHANLLYIQRKKCVLFANDKTLINVLAPAVTRAEIRQLGNLFREHLVRTLAQLAAPNQIVESIVADYHDLGYADTNNRSVLGSMNDLAFHYEYWIQSEGGLQAANFPDIVRRLNAMPMGALDYDLPIKRLRTLYSRGT